MQHAPPSATRWDRDVRVALELASCDGARVVTVRQIVSALAVREDIRHTCERIGYSLRTLQRPNSIEANAVPELEFVRLSAQVHATMRGMVRQRRGMVDAAGFFKELCLTDPSLRMCAENEGLLFELGSSAPIPIPVGERFSSSWAHTLVT